MAKGKCVHCRLGYKWRGRPLLRKAVCPVCGDHLRRTSHLLQWPWSGRRPREQKLLLGFE